MRSVVDQRIGFRQIAITLFGMVARSERNREIDEDGRPCFRIKLTGPESSIGRTPQQGDRFLDVSVRRQEKVSEAKICAGND